MRPRRRAVLLACLAAVLIPSLGIAVTAERDRWLRMHPVLPDLAGKSVTRAAEMMIPLHFGILVTGVVEDPTAPPGTVLSQNPSAGRRLPLGSVIDLRVSLGSGIVPHLRGRLAHQAARQLEVVGLRLGSVRGIEDDAAPGTVLEQYTPPGRQLGPNSPVDVLISRGPEPPGGNAGAAAPALRLSSPVTPADPPRGAVGGGRPYAPAPGGGPAPSPILPSTSPEHLQGGKRVEPGAAQCAAHPKRQRDEVCDQPPGHGRAEPDVHGPEHRDVRPRP